MKLVVIDADDLKSIPTQPLNDQKPNDQHSPYKLSIVAKDSQDKLDQLIAKKGRIVNSPRITTPEHRPGVLRMDVTVPVTLGIQNAEGHYNALVTNPDKDHQLGLKRRFKISVTPSILSSNLIKIDLNVSVEQILCHMKNGTSDKYDSVWIQDILDPPLISNFSIRDNQTIAITGINPTVFGAKNKKPDIVLFLSMRIIRRSE